MNDIRLACELPKSLDGAPAAYVAGLELGPRLTANNGDTIDLYFFWP